MKSLSDLLYTGKDVQALFDDSEGENDDETAISYSTGESRVARYDQNWLEYGVIVVENRAVQTLADYASKRSDGGDQNTECQVRRPFRRQQQWAVWIANRGCYHIREHLGVWQERVLVGNPYLRTQIVCSECWHIK